MTEVFDYNGAKIAYTVLTAHRKNDIQTNASLQTLTSEATAVHLKVPDSISDDEYTYALVVNTFAPVTVNTTWYPIVYKQAGTNDPNAKAYALNIHLDTNTVVVSRTSPVGIPAPSSYPHPVDDNANIDRILRGNLSLYGGVSEFHFPHLQHNTLPVPVNLNLHTLLFDLEEITYHVDVNLPKSMLFNMLSGYHIVHDPVTETVKSVHDTLGGTDPKFGVPDTHDLGLSNCTLRKGVRSGERGFVDDANAPQLSIALPNGAQPSVFTFKGNSTTVAEALPKVITSQLFVNTSSIREDDRIRFFSFVVGPDNLETLVNFSLKDLGALRRDEDTVKETLQSILRGFHDEDYPEYTFDGIQQQLNEGKHPVLHEMMLHLYNRDGTHSLTVPTGADSPPHVPSRWAQQGANQNVFTIAELPEGGVTVHFVLRTSLKIMNLKSDGTSELKYQTHASPAKVISNIDNNDTLDNARVLIVYRLHFTE